MKLDIQLFREDPADAAAWEEIVRRYGHRLRGKVRQVLWGYDVEPDPERVRDIVQDVYCRLLEDGARRLRQFRGWRGSVLVRYLLRTAERVTLDHVRWSRAQRRCPERLAARGWRVCDETALLVGPRDTPEDALMVKERRRLLLDECGRISKPHARERNERVLLMVFEGWTSREISHALDGELAPGSIDCLLHRIRHELERKRREARALYPAGGVFSGASGGRSGALRVWPPGLRDGS